MGIHISLGKGDQLGSSPQGKRESESVQKRCQAVLDSLIVHLWLQKAASRGRYEPVMQDGSGKIHTHSQYLADDAGVSSLLLGKGFKGINLGKELVS